MKTLKVLVMTLLLSGIAFSQTPAERFQKMGDLFMSAYNTVDYALIEQQFNAEMKAAITTDKLKEFLDGSHKVLGKIVRLGTPAFPSASVALFPVDFENGKREMTLSLDAENKIAGFYIGLPQPAKPRNTSRNKTVLRVPFNGEWFVFWGGDTVAENYHQDAPTQRFAFDILKMDAAGKTHTGDGTKNEDYYAFGQEIVADADGEVTDVVTGVHDNVPGVLNPLSAVGNLVMIRHANGEVSVFAHFKYGSTRVKVGDQVTKGQVLGLCGNSGNSTEAHLHYQVQGTRLFAPENSMKVFFEKVMLRRDGKPGLKTEYSPVKGDSVGPVPGSDPVAMPAGDDGEFVRLGLAFGQAYKNGDEKAMDAALADDFRYYANIPCSYKDCDKGAGKADYIKGVGDERRERGFTVKSVEMKPIPPAVGRNAADGEPKVLFYCRLTTAANGRTYTYLSVIAYYFQRREDSWKITKIENLVIER